MPKQRFIPSFTAFIVLAALLAAVRESNADSTPASKDAADPDVVDLDAPVAPSLGVRTPPTAEPAREHVNPWATREAAQEAKPAQKSTEEPVHEFRNRFRREISDKPEREATRESNRAESKTEAAKPVRESRGIEQPASRPSEPAPSRSRGSRSDKPASGGKSGGKQHKTFEELLAELSKMRKQGKI